MFSDNILNSPRNNASDLEKLIRYSEILKFTGHAIKNAVVLENGYASSEILNSRLWQPNKAGRKVLFIDVVFTRYPLKKEDWLTNYYDLLTDRLKELFKLDPALNDKDITYRMTVQTGCLSDEEARNYFHGIVIYYEDIRTDKPAVYPTQKRDAITQERLKLLKNQVPDSSINLNEYIRYYDEQLPVDDDEVEKPTKSKQKCPDFSKKRKLF